jgi:hypothetical protein
LTPSNSITTDAVLLLDDNVHVSAAHVMQLYETWKHYRTNMIGFEPQGPAVNIKAGRAKYISVSDDVAIMHRHLLDYFSCNGDSDSHLLKKIHTRLTVMADESPGCDGLALAAIAPHHNGAVPMYVQPLATDYVGKCSSGLRRYVDTSIADKSRTARFMKCHAKLVPISMAYKYPSRFTYISTETVAGSSSSTGREWKVKLHKEEYKEHARDPFEVCVRDDNRTSSAAEAAATLPLPVFEWLR